MKDRTLLPFKQSAVASIGIELEYQIVDAHSFALVSSAKNIIRNMTECVSEAKIKPEITQSMIEINSSIHLSPTTMLQELIDLQGILVAQVIDANIALCGGGTHPFQQWFMQKIFPIKRYKNLAHRFGYLSKRATVFGQHVHVGCNNAEDALYLTHALIRYVPHLIAISASSPYSQGVDTGFHSCRSTLFNAFPTSGVMPYLQNWQEFSSYFYKMRRWGIIESMKDIYWDIRPKPEFGTVEIRVCDTPLSIKKAVIIAAYIQALSLYLIKERPIQVTHDLYYTYKHNRFQASRYGFEGKCIDPVTDEKYIIVNDVLATIKKIEPYAKQWEGIDYIKELKDDVLNKRNDTVVLRDLFKKVGTYPKLVALQCRRWLNHA